MRRFLLVWYAIGVGVLALVAYFVPALERLEPFMIGIIAVGSPLVIYVILLRQFRLEERAARIAAEAEEREARADNLNGYLVRVVDALGAVQEIMQDRVWDSLPDRVKARLLLIEDRIGNLGARMQGWRELDEARTRVIEEYEKEKGTPPPHHPKGGSQTIPPRKEG